MLTSPGAIAFQIGPLVIRWYGILMATAIIVGLWIAHRQAKKEGLPADVVEMAVAEKDVSDAGRIETRGEQTPDEAEAAAGVEQHPSRGRVHQDRGLIPLGVEGPAGTEEHDARTRHRGRA